MMAIAAHISKSSRSAWLLKGAKPAGQSSTETERDAKKVCGSATFLTCISTIELIYWYAYVYARACATSEHRMFWGGGMGKGDTTQPKKDAQTLGAFPKVALDRYSAVVHTMLHYLIKSTHLGNTLKLPEMVSERTALAQLANMNMTNSEVRHRPVFLPSLIHCFPLKQQFTLAVTSAEEIQLSSSSG